jgi:predicted transcriptional regulator
MMPQIWMTYGEIAALLGCSPETVRAQAAYRALDRKKSRDGMTRVKLDAEWAADFVAAIRDADPALDKAIRELQMIRSEMARDAGHIFRRQSNNSA